MCSLSNEKEWTTDIDGARGHHGEWKPPIPKGYILCDPIYITLLKWPKQWDEEQISDCQGQGMGTFGVGMAVKEWCARANTNWKWGFNLPAENKGRDLSPLPFLRPFTLNKTGKFFLSLWNVCKSFQRLYKPLVSFTIQSIFLKDLATISWMESSRMIEPLSPSFSGSLTSEGPVIKTGEGWFPLDKANGHPNCHMNLGWTTRDKWCCQVL